ncbi:MAG TPA: XdhC family protein [Thermoanaerobaculia bacterium]|jgi:xanthine/CO dehydrogenase XdhC/CoxF family maturation factor|nr:XdhC family protein [Thermoanaerobaculia bacterium]
MNHWKETAEILTRLAELKAAGRRAALATVTHIVGSAYRRPGAKFLIEETGDTLGSVSGGCLEADVREIAMGVLATGTPSLRHYSTGADEDIVWGLGLGCNGLVDVFIQSATAGPLAEFTDDLRALLTGDSPFVVATVVDGVTAGSGLGAVLIVAPEGSLNGSLGSVELDLLAAEHARGLTSAGRSTVQTIAGRGVFFEVLPPPPHLVVCGAGDDARPLVAYAADAGFRVTVIDHRPALLAPQWFPQAARLVPARPEDRELDLPPAGRALAVVKTHSLAHDREWARRLLAAGLPYVGMLGPHARRETILREIGLAGDERVFGPVGLDLGADGPRQVAFAIVAELLAFIAGREPRHLCERKEAIHAA